MTETAEISEFGDSIESIDNRYKNNGIHYYKISAENFYKRISQDPDKYKTELGTCFPVCVGGLFRSPPMSDFLLKKGLKQTEDYAKGHTLLKLSDQIETATITNEGKILLTEYPNRPIDTLLVSLDLGADEDMQNDGLLALIGPLIRLQNKFPENKILLNIIVVDGDEYDTQNYYNQYAQ